MHAIYVECILSICDLTNFLVQELSYNLVSLTSFLLFEPASWSPGQFDHEGIGTSWSAGLGPDQFGQLLAF